MPPDFPRSVHKRTKSDWARFAVCDPGGRERERQHVKWCLSSVTFEYGRLHCVNRPLKSHELWVEVVCGVQNFLCDAEVAARYSFSRCPTGRFILCGTPCVLQSCSLRPGKNGKDRRRRRARARRWEAENGLFFVKQMGDKCSDA